MIREDWRRINNEHELTLLLKDADVGKFMAVILSSNYVILILILLTLDIFTFRVSPTHVCYDCVNPAI